MTKILALAASASLMLCAGAASAYPALPNLVNLNFQDYTGSAPKGSFDSVKPVGWTGGSGLIFIDSTTPGKDAASSTYLQTYGDPTGSYVGNYVEADGNPEFGSGFNYSVSGLTIGQTYTLDFYQGASQQTGFHGATTNQWIVSLGTHGLDVAIHDGQGAYSNPDASASVVASPLMYVPDGGAVGFNFVSVDLTADATTDLLSFLAWGDNGSTANLPPMAFLAGVDSAPGLGASVPEPAAWAMMIIGVMGVGGLARRRRTGRVSTAAGV